MIIKSVRQVGDTTEVELEYVGNRHKTLVMSQETLEEFDKSKYTDVAEFIKHKYGTDFKNSKNNAKR